MLKSCTRQLGRQVLPLKVHRNESQGRGNRNFPRRQALPLPRLGGRMIHLKDAEPAIRMGSTKGGRIEASPQNLGWPEPRPTAAAGSCSANRLRAARKARNPRERWLSSRNPIAIRQSPSAQDAPGHRVVEYVGPSRSWREARRMATRYAVRLNFSSFTFIAELGLKPGPEPWWESNPNSACSISSRRPPPGLARLAGTNLAQKFPGIDSQLVSVVPMKPDRIFTHALGRQGLDRGLEHGECPGRRLANSGFAPALGALIVAQGAGAGVAQECERVMRTMAVFPIDVHARAVREIYFDRFGICRARHESQYRTNPEGSQIALAPGFTHTGGLAWVDLGCAAGWNPTRPQRSGDPYQREGKKKPSAVRRSRSEQRNSGGFLVAAERRMLPSIPPCRGWSSGRTRGRLDREASAFLRSPLLFEPVCPPGKHYAVDRELSRCKCLNKDQARLPA